MAIEEIKLELELEGRDDIGTVYDAGKEYDFFTDLRTIFSDSSEEIFAIDLYFDASAFDAYFSNISRPKTIRVLCGKHAYDLPQCTERYSSQHNVDVSIRKTREVHDRLIFIDKSDCFIIGSSIKDGEKATTLSPHTPKW